MIEFCMPSLGADMESGKLVEWLVKPGQHVKRGDVVAVVETDKGAVDVEIWDTGVVDELVAQPEDIVPVGGLLARLSAETKAEAAPATPAQDRIKISPAARRRAQELGIDVGALQPTSGDGVISLTDVEKAVPATTAPAHPVVDKAAAMRHAIAAAMTKSKREIPHYYLSTTLDAEAALTWLTQENAQRGVKERILFGALLLRAVAIALKEVPELNGFWIDGAFKPSPVVNLGVGIGLRGGGLIAPAILDAGALSLTQTMTALATLIDRARGGALRSSELTDGTVTVTNLGDQGVETVYGVIYPPQVAVVGFGRIVERPWVRNGALCTARVLTATLSADHRASVGHRGALFLGALNRLLQVPETLR